MAIVFQQQLSVTNWLNAYNDNIVKFNSNSGKTPSKCEITVSGNTFEITPNLSGTFRYNLKEIVRVLVDNKFIDTLNGTNYYANDTSLFKALAFTYKITFTDTTTETTSVTYNFLKRVEQIGKFTTKAINTNHILNGNNVYYWYGLPFDITVTGTSAFNVVNADGQSITITPSSQITRLQLSNINYVQRGLNDGYTFETNTCYTFDEPFLTPTLTIAGQTVNLYRSTNTCGVYLRWFNTEIGAYSYYKFNPIYKETLNTKEIDSYKVEFDGVNTELITGKTEFTELSVNESNLDDNQFAVAKTILSSPKIVLWQDNQWQSVLLSDGSYEVRNTKKLLNKIRFNLKLNRYSY